MNGFQNSTASVGCPSSICTYPTPPIPARKANTCQRSTLPKVVVPVVVVGARHIEASWVSKTCNNFPSECTCNMQCMSDWESGCEIWLLTQPGPCHPDNRASQHLSTSLFICVAGYQTQSSVNALEANFSPRWENLETIYHTLCAVFIWVLNIKWQIILSHRAAINLDSQKT